MSPRLIAAQTIARWLATGDFPDRIVADNVADHPFITSLVRETVRRKGTLDFFLKKFLKRKPDPTVYAFLMVGACELLFIPSTAEYAAINSTVDAVKLHDRHAGGFTNAVLRNVQREKEALLRELESAPADIRFSHPASLVRRWRAQFGDAVADSICAVDNLPAETTLTVLPFTDSEKAASLAKRICAAGFNARPHPLEPGAVVVGHGAKIPDLPGFAEGEFIVQDAAPLASIRLLNPQPGETILDACAAPGGKTMQLAALVGQTGKIVAGDLYQNRLDRLMENIRRMSFEDRVEAIQCDSASTELADKVKGRHFDAILADVPCSNTGVLRKRADARWRFTPQRLKTLHETQLAILENLAILNPGRIVYSTCSIEKEEDEDVIQSFLSNHPDWQLEKMEKLLPDETPRDGAFAALMSRRPTSL